MYRVLRYVQNLYITWHFLPYFYKNWKEYERNILIILIMPKLYSLFII